MQKVERQPSKWEKITAKEASDKWLISKIYKHSIPSPSIYVCLFPLSGSFIDSILSAYCNLIVPDSFVTSCTVAYQVPLPMGLPRQEFSSGLPFSSPEDLPDPKIGTVPPSLQGDSLLLSHEGSPQWDITQI